MRYNDFVEFYKIASAELNLAERMEGLLVEKHPTLPVTRGEYVSSSINHLRESIEHLDTINPQLSKSLGLLEAKYQKLADRDRDLYSELLNGFETEMTTAFSVLDQAWKHYFFFRREVEEGYSYEEYIKYILFHLENTASRLEKTAAFPVLCLHVGLVKCDLEKVLERDNEFRKMAAGFPN